jgi:hypothetical protein
MNPIPNPGDLSPQDRRRIYGPGYRLSEGGHVYRTAGHRIERVSRVSPAPVRAQTVSTPPVAAARPPIAAVAPPPTPPTKLQQLQTAVSQSATQGASLSVSPDIVQGKPGGVSLSLPGNLFDMLRDQAAKFGFRRAARQAEVSATLAGNGYAISPANPQTVPLKHGEAPKFFWQVTPGQNANGPLQAQVNATLTGQGAPKLLSLGSLQSAAVQVAAQAEQTANGLHLPSLSHFLAKLFGHADQAAPASAAPSPSASPLHDVTLPVIGRMSVRAQVAAFLAFLAVLILLLIQRNMADQRRSAERRRYRSMNSGYRPMDMDAEPSEPAPAS